MIVIGIDAHKRTHTAVATDQMGQQLSTKTVGTTSKDHLTLLQWATGKDDDQRLRTSWARNKSVGAMTAPRALTISTSKVKAE